MMRLNYWKDKWETGSQFSKSISSSSDWFILFICQLTTIGYDISTTSGRVTFEGWNPSKYQVHYMLQCRSTSFCEVSLSVSCLNITEDKLCQAVRWKMLHELHLQGVDYNTFWSTYRWSGKLCTKLLERQVLKVKGWSREVQSTTKVHTCSFCV